MSFPQREGTTWWQLRCAANLQTTSQEREMNDEPISPEKKGKEKEMFGTFANVSLLSDSVDELCTMVAPRRRSEVVPFPNVRFLRFSARCSVNTSKN